MTDVGLNIVELRQDPLMRERLKTGRYRINQELNQEWLDVRNEGDYVLNLQGRVLAAMRREGPRAQPRGFHCLRSVLIQSPQAIALHPGQRVRIFTGEQPRERTHISDQLGIHRVLWMVQSAYLWVPDCQEVHIYFSQADLKNHRSPLSRYVLH